MARATAEAEAIEAKGDTMTHEDPHSAIEEDEAHLHEEQQDVRRGRQQLQEVRARRMQVALEDAREDEALENDGGHGEPCSEKDSRCD